MNENRVERFARIRERAQSDEDIAFLLAEVERGTDAMVEALKANAAADKPASTEPEVFPLTGWDEEFMPGVLPLLFGIMVNKTDNVTTHYRSDLFHDAHWLTRHVNGECSFYWAARGWGCNIGTDPKLVGYGRNDEKPFNLYRIDVFKRDRGYWCARFTLVADTDEVEALPDLPALSNTDLFGRNAY